jgi:hypothetical protein
MSYINKWLRGHNIPEKPRSKSLDVEALERSGIRMIANVIHQFSFVTFIYQVLSMYMHLSHFSLKNL